MEKREDTHKLKIRNFAYKQRSKTPYLEGTVPHIFGGTHGTLDTLKKQHRIDRLCQKEKQTKTDKDRMLVIHADILTSIESLDECELCGAITEIIVTMTLADVTAKLCKGCGVKSLE